jgi:hypothetical protein
MALKLAGKWWGSGGEGFVVAGPDENPFQIGHSTTQSPMDSLFRVFLQNISQFHVTFVTNYRSFDGTIGCVEDVTKWRGSSILAGPGGYSLLMVTAHRRVPWTHFLLFLLRKTPRYDVTFVLKYRSVDGTIAGREVVGKSRGWLNSGKSWWESVSYLS